MGWKQESISHYDSKTDTLIPGATAYEKDMYEAAHNGYGWMLFYKELYPELAVPYMRWDGVMLDLEEYIRMDDDADGEEGRWITTENGHHVYLNEEGDPDKGNPHVIEAMTGGSTGKKTALSSDQREKYGADFERVFSGISEEGYFQEHVNYKAKDYDPATFRESEARQKAYMAEVQRICGEMPDGALIAQGSTLFEKLDNGKWKFTSADGEREISNDSAANFLSIVVSRSGYLKPRLVESADECVIRRDVELHDPETYKGWADDLNSKSRKDLVKRAKKDPEFKELVDNIVLYTEGGYADQRKTLEDAATTGLKDASAETVGEYVNNSVYKIRNLWKAQQLENSDSSIAGGMAHLTQVINSSKPVDKTLYRVAQDRNIAKTGDHDPYVPPKKGDVISITAPTSFTDNYAVEQDLSTQKMGDIIHYELEPGAKAVNVAELSRYKQSEYLSSGQFEVTDIKTEVRHMPIYRDSDITPAVEKRGIKENKWGDKYVDRYICTIRIRRVGDTDLKGKHDSADTFIYYEGHFDDRMVEFDDRRDAEEEPASWITVNGNHIPLDKDGNPIGGQMKALGKGRSADIAKRQQAKLKKVLDKDGTPDDKYDELRDVIKNCEVGSTFRIGNRQFTKMKDTDDERDFSLAFGNSDHANATFEDAVHLLWYSTFEENNPPEFLDRDAQRDEIKSKVDSLRKEGKVSGTDECRKMEEGFINKSSPDFGKPGTYVMYRSGAIGKGGMLFFSPDKAGADQYADLHDNKTGQYTVEIKNPLVITGETDPQCVRRAWEALHPGKKAKSPDGSKWVTMDKQNASALSKSEYDAIIYKIGDEPHEIQIPARQAKRLSKIATYSTTKWGSLGCDLEEAIMSGNFDKDPEDYKRLDSRYDSIEYDGYLNEEFRYFLLDWKNANSTEEEDYQAEESGCHGDGGPGSGNFGHKGRKGEVGGSAPGEGTSEGGKETKAAKVEWIKSHKPTFVINAKGEMQGTYDDGDEEGVYLSDPTTGEILYAEDMVANGWHAPEYTGKIDFGGAIPLTQDEAQGKYERLLRNQYEQEGKATLTSEECEGMFESLTLRGNGDDSARMCAVQDPDSYKELFSLMSDKEKEEYKKHAENVERYISLSNSDAFELFRGMSFNDSVPGQKESIERVLSELKVGNEISARHTESWSTQEAVAKDFSYGAADLELEDGENYAIVYRVNFSGIGAEGNKFAETSGFNPSGEYLGSKDNKFVVTDVSYDYDKRFRAHRYSVELSDKAHEKEDSRTDSHVRTLPSCSELLDKIAECGNGYVSGKVLGFAGRYAGLGGLVKETREDDEDWVTIKGTHVLLNEEGVAQSGGKLKGQKFSKAKSSKKGKRESSPGTSEKVKPTVEAVSSAMKPISQEYNVTLEDDLDDFMRKNAGNRRRPTPLYELYNSTEDSGGDGGLAIEDEFFKARHSLCTKDLKEISRDEADEILYDNLRHSTVNAWAREYNHEVKEALIWQMTQSPEVHNAALNVMYTNYKYSCEENGEKPLGYEEFLTTPIKMYRGGTGKEYDEASLFSSYTFSRKVAESFTGSEVGQGAAYDPNGVVYEAEIKPIDTYGSIFANGESEIYVPRPIAPNGNRDSREDDEDWVTINGTHVLLNENGEALSGGKLKGMTFSRAKSSRSGSSDKESGGPKSVSKKSEAQKAIRKANSKCAQLRQRYKELLEERNKFAIKSFSAKMRMEDAQSHEERVGKELEKAKAEAKKYNSGRNISQIDSDMERKSREIDELNQWFDEHPRHHGMTPEERQERREKQDERSRKTDEYLNDSSEKAAYKELDRVRKKYDEARQEAQKLRDDFAVTAMQDPSKSIQDLKDEYEEAAKKRNELTLKAYPTAADCDSAQAVTDYLRAKQYFNQDGGSIDADSNVELSSVKTERAVVIAEHIDKVMTDYPELVGKLTGVECHDMSNEPNHSTDFAYAKDMLICFNERYYGENGELEKVFADARARQPAFSPAGVDHTYMLDHEITHAIEKLINRRLPNGEKAGNIVMRRVIEKRNGTYDESLEKDVRAMVSDYASNNLGVKTDNSGNVISTDDNYGRNTEFLAEANGEARCSNDPSDIAKEAREELERLMKEVGLK